MSEELDQSIKDADCMEIYDLLVNHAESEPQELDRIIDHLYMADKTGQFLASSARYLHAVNPEVYHAQIGRLIEGAIDKDREHRYIGSLLEAIWGQDYREKAQELGLTDDNFRRIYKRIFPKEESL